jgi:hypothetical protein
MNDDDHLRDTPDLPGGPEYDGGPDIDPDLAGAVGDELAGEWVPLADDPDVLGVAVEQLRAELAIARTAAHVWEQRHDSMLRMEQQSHHQLVTRTRERDEARAEARQREADNLDLIARLEVADSILTVEQARDAQRQRKLLAEERAASIEAERHEALTRPARPQPMRAGLTRDEQDDELLGDELRHP